jgi:hypothetical protein
VWRGRVSRGRVKGGGVKGGRRTKERRLVINTMMKEEDAKEEW